MNSYCIDPFYNCTSSIQSITFGNSFNQDLSNTAFPSSLQSITFGENFNQDLSNTAFPSSLQSIMFGNSFNQSLSNTAFPSSLQSITFGKNFNQDLSNTALPASLQTIGFRENFNQDLSNTTFPSSLKVIHFYGTDDRYFDKRTWYDKLLDIFPRLHSVQGSVWNRLVATYIINRGIDHFPTTQIITYTVRQNYDGSFD